MSPANYSIGTKIFGAFVAMSAIIAILGAAGYGVLASAGDMAVTTFDGPLMAINYARAAQTDFTVLQMDELRYEKAQAAEKPEIAADITDTTAVFGDDLAVAEQRSFAADEQRLIRQIRALVGQWRVARGRADMKTLERLDTQIDDKFDLLVELNTDHSFVSRRQTVSNVANYRYATIGATVLALLLAAAITLFLRRRIIRPLSAAAAVADRIAKGELQTEIPSGGADETGALLKSMTVMQDNIRGMMTRETSLRLSAENRLADALETSREGVILAAADGRIVLANSALRDFFPAIAASLVSGAVFAEALRLIQSQLAVTPNQPGGAGLTGQDKLEPAELELADGRWARMTANATSDGGSIMLLSDFTLVKEREESLRRATRAAEAANAAKTRFLANMSHELRTPLNAIIGFSEIISGQLFGAVGNSRYLDYSGDILRSGRHLLNVINSVLDLAKSESGKITLDVHATDMSEVLLDCVTMVREQIAAAGLDFEVSGLDQKLPLSGDPAKLRQIFLNLLSNAMKFTASGGRVWLNARVTPEGVAVTVGDSGIGMSAEDIDVALQPFGQVDNRLERRYEGTGLGLPLTRALVDLHGGSMSFDSARNQGTKVTVVFPARGANQLTFAAAS
jgi:signal transduction histidine kinase